MTDFMTWRQLYGEKERDRLRQVQWSRERLRRKDFLVVDTETTGFGDADPVELCAIDDRGEVVFESLVKPLVPLTVGAIAIHGITPAQVLGAPLFEEIVADFERAIAGKLLVFYNAGFDTRILQNAYGRLGRSLPFFPYECAMIRYATFVGEAGVGKSYKRQKLPGAGHRAQADAMATLSLLKLMAAAEPVLPVAKEEAIAWLSLQGISDDILQTGILKI